MAPRLRSIRPSDIRRTLGCGETYAIGLRGGARVPHPRLIRQLAGVAGVAYPEGFPGPEGLPWIAPAGRVVSTITTSPGLIPASTQAKPRPVGPGLRSPLR